MGILGLDADATGIPRIGAGGFVRSAFSIAAIDLLSADVAIEIAVPKAGTAGAVDAVDVIVRRMMGNVGIENVLTSGYRGQRAATSEATSSGISAF